MPSKIFSPSGFTPPEARKAGFGAAFPFTDRPGDFLCRGGTSFSEFYFEINWFDLQQHND
jgi:hypothetical protein